MLLSNIIIKILNNKERKKAHMQKTGLQSSASQLFEALMDVKRQGMRFKPNCTIRPSEFYLLHTIYRCCEAPEHAGGIRVSDISRMTHQSMPAVSQNLRALLSLGLVQRSNIRRDRRSALLYPTEEGIALMEQAGASFSLLLEEVARRMGEEDTKRLAALLHRLNEVLKEILPHSSERKE